MPSADKRAEEPSIGKPKLPYEYRLSLEVGYARCGGDRALVRGRLVASARSIGAWCRVDRCPVQG